MPLLRRDGRCEPLAPLGAAALQNRASGLGLHPLSESVLTKAFNSAGLKCPLHLGGSSLSSRALRWVSSRSMLFGWAPALHSWHLSDTRTKFCSFSPALEDDRGRSTRSHERSVHEGEEVDRGSAGAYRGVSRPVNAPFSRRLRSDLGNRSERMPPLFRKASRTAPLCSCYSADTNREVNPRSRDIVDRALCGRVLDKAETPGPAPSSSTFVRSTVTLYCYFFN